MVKYPFEKNSIYIGDCKDVLKEFPEESVDLIYLDPPFFSNRNYEIIWEDGSELRAFEDRWKGGINQYINWMRERIEPIYDMLKETGSFYLHCDHHASHYLKVALDDIFGKDNFRNEIVWHYPNKVGHSKYQFLRKHDTILFYSKNETNFNIQKAEITNPKTIKRYDHEDENGRYKIYYTDGKKRKKYLDGKRVGDVWSINWLAGNDSERLGYPTQKPKELLKRIIKASSNEGNLVLDPFCGCGTTLAVAEDLNRDWIGIDVSRKAAETMKKRITERYPYLNPTVYGVPKSIEEIKNLEPFDFQSYIVEWFDGKHQTKKTGDKGIDGWTENNIPLQIKQSEGIGRNVVDNFETAIRRDKKKKGIIVALSFSKGAHEEAARVKNEENFDITLLKLEELPETVGDPPATTSLLQDYEPSQKTLNGG